MYKEKPGQSADSSLFLTTRTTKTKTPRQPQPYRGSSAPAILKLNTRLGNPRLLHADGGLLLLLYLRPLIPLAAVLAVQLDPVGAGAQLAGQARADGLRPARVGRVLALALVLRGLAAREEAGHEAHEQRAEAHQAGADDGGEGLEHAPDDNVDVVVWGAC